MRILITNDDGYQAKGIKVLAEIMKQYGDVTVIAPKNHQSGMSMAVSLGFKQIAHKNLGDGWQLLRMSVHEPLLVLNCESNKEGGVEKMLAFFKAFIEKYEKLDISKLN